MLPTLETLCQTLRRIPPAPLTSQRKGELKPKLAIVIVRPMTVNMGTAMQSLDPMNCGESPPNADWLYQLSDAVQQRTRAADGEATAGVLISKLSFSFR
jgi:hypothetical protein